MRGGAQSHLLEAEDGNWYVVKFRNNPQHRRVLVNEILASVFLDYLKIAAPETAMIQITRELLAQNPELHLLHGSRVVPVAPGWHFGSRFPGDPSRLNVYNILPAELLPKVENLHHFRGALVFDQWVSNADGRQSVFFRAMVEREGERPKPGFVTQMIDHGFAFEGPGWTFSDSPLYGLYKHPFVYESVRSLDDFEPWLGMVEHFPEEVIDRAMKRVPVDWLEEDDAEELPRMLERLYARRVRLPVLLQDCRNASPHVFRNWVKTGR
jgi:hypothetical protein